jgi:hypothetical protein
MLPVPGSGLVPVLVPVPVLVLVPAPVLELALVPVLAAHSRQTSRRQLLLLSLMVQ